MGRGCWAIQHRTEHGGRYLASCYKSKSMSFLSGVGVFWWGLL